MHRQLLIAACVLASFAGQKVFADAMLRVRQLRPRSKKARLRAWRASRRISSRRLRFAARPLAQVTLKPCSILLAGCTPMGVASRDDAVAAGLFADCRAAWAHSSSRCSAWSTPNPVLPDYVRRSRCLLRWRTPRGSRTRSSICLRREIVEAGHARSTRYIIEPDLALAVVAAESNFQFDARSDKGAVGVMQLIRWPRLTARCSIARKVRPFSSVLRTVGRS